MLVQKAICHRGVHFSLGPDGGHNLLKGVSEPQFVEGAPNELKTRHFSPPNMAFGRPAPQDCAIIALTNQSKQRYIQTDLHKHVPRSQTKNRTIKCCDIVFEATTLGTTDLPINGIFIGKVFELQAKISKALAFS